MEFLRSYYHTPGKKEMNSSVYITWTGHRICLPDHAVGPRVLENYKLILVTKGRGVFRQNDIEYSIGPGDIFALFPGIKHYYSTDPDDPWELRWVSFNGRQCKDLMEMVRLTPEASVIKEAVSHSIIDIMENILEEMKNDTRQNTLKATGFVYMLFSELISLRAETDKNTSGQTKYDSVKKALNFIDLNYYNDIDVDLLCKYINISRSYFSRSFKSSVGITVPEYINRVRIQRAKLLLENSELNINEIAKSVGFDDQFYFSRIFSKIEGVPPIHYRKRK